MARFEPALPNENATPTQAARGPFWAPRRSHAIAIGILLACGALALSRPTEFLYFQF